MKQAPAFNPAVHTNINYKNVEQNIKKTTYELYYNDLIAAYWIFDFDKNEKFLNWETDVLFDPEA